MERVILKSNSGAIACNNKIIYTDKDKSEIGKEIRDSIITDWVKIYPKYYRYLDDNCLIEIWNNEKGIVLDNGLCKLLENGWISDYWSKEHREEISYKKAMEILKMMQDKGYNNKGLMNKKMTQTQIDFDKKEDLGNNIRELNFDTAIRTGNNRYKVGEWVSVGETKRKIKGFRFYMPTLTYLYTFEDSDKETPEEILHTLLQNYFENEKHKPMNCRNKEVKQNNNGGASDWYALPKNANTLQDLIEHRNMNGSVKDIFKACYRLGIKTEDELRDLNKMAYYSLREVGRITGRKDYLTIAKELIGSQAKEKHKYNDYCNHDDDEDLV